MDPVTLKAYWSEIMSVGMAGLSHFRTINFSARQLKIGVTDIVHRQKKTNWLTDLRYRSDSTQPTTVYYS